MKKKKKIRIVKQKNRQLKKKVKNLEVWIREHQPQTVGAKFHWLDTKDMKF